MPHDGLSEAHPGDGNGAFHADAVSKFSVISAPGPERLPDLR